MVPHAVNPATIFINLIFNKPIYRLYWMHWELDFDGSGSIWSSSDKEFARMDGNRKCRLSMGCTML